MLRTIKVKKLLSSRYPAAKRPASWDQRLEGEDVIEAESGEVVSLWSEGSQSPPQAGWTIILRTESVANKPRWTLFGI